MANGWLYTPSFAPYGKSEAGPALAGPDLRALDIPCALRYNELWKFHFPHIAQLDITRIINLFEQALVVESQDVPFIQEAVEQKLVEMLGDPDEGLKLCGSGLGC